MIKANFKLQTIMKSHFAVPGVLQLGTSSSFCVTLLLFDGKINLCYVKDDDLLSVGECQKF